MHKWGGESHIAAACSDRLSERKELYHSFPIPGKLSKHKYNTAVNKSAAALSFLMYSREGQEKNLIRQSISAPIDLLQRG